MIRIGGCVVIGALLLLAEGQTSGQGEGGGKGTKNSQVSFKNDISPIIKKNCLPCHAADSFNPSELSLDSYDDLMSGGKHGSPVVPGKSKESIIIKKLGSAPPFGDRMPLDPKKKKGEPSTKHLSDDEIKLIATWIDQGAKKN